MLVLKRTSGQQIIIAGDIRITVLKVQRGRVELGIEAPSDALILRGELEPHENSQVFSPPDTIEVLR